jgi:hypothetical protein
METFSGLLDFAAGNITYFTNAISPLFVLRDQMWALGAAIFQKLWDGARSTIEPMIQYVQERLTLFLKLLAALGVKVPSIPGIPQPPQPGKSKSDASVVSKTVVQAGTQKQAIWNANGGQLSRNGLNVVGDRPGTGWGPDAEIITPTGYVLSHAASELLKSAGILGNARSYGNGSASLEKMIKPGMMGQMSSSRSVNVTVNANYARTESPVRVSNDITAILTMAGI